MDNVTGIINIVNLKKNTLDFTSLSVDQKAKASASIESCIESNFTLSHPPHEHPPNYKKNGTEGSLKFKQQFYSRVVHVLKLIIWVYCWCCLFFKDHPHHHTGDYKPKYENRNNPVRAMVCVAKSLIENVNLFGVKN